MKARRPPASPSLAKMQAQCEAFNAKHAVGDTIRVWPGEIEGEPTAVEIRYPARVLSGHTPVVYVTGGQGCIALSHVAGGAADMPSFADDLHALCIAEIQRAYSRPDASGQMVADLTSATASAIALLMAHSALGTQQLAQQTADSLPVMVAQKAAHARSGLRELGALVWPADAEVPPARTRGPLNAADASALGTSLDAGTLVILARDRASRPSAAIWAAGVSASTLPDAEAQQLWAAFIAISRKAAETQT